VKRKTYSASSGRTTTNRRRTSAARKRSGPRRSAYGPIFFLILAVTVASAVGFLGVVASVLAGT
jgi:hypothetical protein